MMYDHYASIIGLRTLQTLYIFFRLAPKEKKGYDSTWEGKLPKKQWNQPLFVLNAVIWLVTRTVNAQIVG